MGVFAPRERDIGLQIVQLDAILRTLGVEHVQLVKFFLKSRRYFLRPFLATCFLLQLTLLGSTVSPAQFFLDILDLLLQEILTLLLIQILTGLEANLCTDMEKLQFAVEQFQHIEHTVHHIGIGQQRHLLLDTEGKIGAEEV